MAEKVTGYAGWLVTWKVTLSLNPKYESVEY